MYLILYNLPGNGFYSPGPNQLIVNSNCAEIGPFFVPDTFSTLLGFTWRYKPLTNNTGSIIETLFTLSEYVNNQFTGSTDYGIKSRQHNPGGNNENSPNIEGDETNNINDMSANHLHELTIQPNPFDDNFSLYYRGNPNALIMVELKDLTGRNLTSGRMEKLNANGELMIALDAQKIGAGIYVIQTTENDFVFTKKVVKIKK